MKPQDNLQPEDVATVRDLRAHVSGLDSFIPPAPPFEQIERPTVVSHRSGRPGTGIPIRGLPVGLAAVAVAVAVILASGFWGPKRAAVGPASSSPTSSGLPSPSHVSTPSLAPTPEPSATLPPGAVFRGQIGSVALSPGGTEIAMTIRAEGEAPTVRIIGLDGRPIESIDAWDFAWIDDSTYVALDYGRVQVGTTASVFVGHVGSTAREKIAGSFAAPVVAGPGGAVALELKETGSNHYQIWTKSGLSEVHDGVPIAFSPDGLLLAVVHYPVACCAGAPSPAPTRAPGPPTLDVVRVNTGQSLATNANVEWAYSAYLAFSPDSRRIAFSMYPKAGTYGERVGVMDIATRKLWVIEPDPKASFSFGTPLWTDSAHLTLQGGTGILPAGLAVSVTFTTDDVSGIFPSPDGKIATIQPNSSTVVVANAGATKTYDLPDVGNWAEWSPDGSLLVVTCGATGNYPVVFDLVVIRP